MTTIRASDIQPRPTTWLWIGRIPRRGITTIGGWRGEGKSTFVSWLAARLTTADDAMFPEAVNVLYAAIEDDPHETVVPRLEAAGADLTHIHFADPDESLWFPRDAQELARLIEDWQLGAVVLDPLSSYMRYTSPESARLALTPLARVSRNLNCAILLVGHLRKSARSLAEALGGATAIQDASRAIYIFGPEPKPDPLLELLLLRREGIENDETAGKKVVLACDKLNLAEKPPSLLFSVETVPSVGGEAVYLNLVGEVAYTSEQVYQAQVSQRQSPETEDAKLDAAINFLLTELADGPRPTKELNELARDAGITPRTLERARAKLRCKALPPTTERPGWWVELPPTDWNEFPR